jgi:SAM-dependent methyltransferase
MKLNLGCGFNKKDGYVNVDKFETCAPDRVVDLEQTPWPFETSSVDEIQMIHVLEHLGADTDVFLAIVKELHRVCRPGARVLIEVPHPRHETFLNDPTHVRVVTPGVLSLFSKANCREWESLGVSNTPLALYIDVDFEIRKNEMILEQRYLDLLMSGQKTEAEIMELVATLNNVVKEYRLELEVLKA